MHIKISIFANLLTARYFKNEKQVLFYICIFICFYVQSAWFPDAVLGATEKAEIFIAYAGRHPIVLVLCHLDIASTEAVAAI